MKTLKTTTLIAIIFAAFVLRLLPIEWGLPGKNLTVTTYNPDEPGSYHTIEKWKPKELKFPAGATLDWGNLHLFTLASILKLGEIFGYIKVGNREFYLNNLREADRLYIVGRLISIIAGTLSVWLLYLVIQNTFRNSAIALLGSAILAIIPVHLINSFYVRPDILMVLFGLCLFYFSTKLIETGSRKHYVICAIFAGITTGTKYSGGVYLILLIIAHIIYLLQKRSFSIRKIVNKDLLLVFLIYFITFVVTCPYVLSPVFPAHIKHLLLQATKGSLYDQPGWIRYLTYFLPYGMGWPLFLSSSAGWVILLFACRKDKEPKKIFIAFSGPVIYFFISLPKFQMTWHTLPLIPFLSTYSAYFFYRFWNWENRVINTVSKFVIVFVMFYTSAYSLAHLRLYCWKNWT